jgi:pimeloyl-ACP methyl ester carboxylesterase
MRSCLQLKIDGQWLRGTCHEPPGAANAPGPRRIGVLFGNSGWLPRSGRGDLYAHLADALAQNGYWAFRFDMPGLGDSDGDVPAEPAELFSLFQGGGHGPFTCSLADELKKRYGLENMILGGHCGSATSAVYAALLDNCGVVSGLLLIELGFYAEPRGALANPAPGQPVSPLRASFAKARFVARRWVLSAPGRHTLRALYRRSLRATERFLKLDLPINSNTRLIDAWRRVMDKGLPTLLIHAQRPAAQPMFDYLAYLMVDQQPGITAVTIEGTTHSLLENHGGEAVRTRCLAWLRAHFPTQSLAGDA